MSLRMNIGGRPSAVTLGYAKQRQRMHGQISIRDSLANDIIDSVDKLIVEAETDSKPLEIEPFRGRLFELFVTGEAAGCVRDDADPDLTAEALCRVLASRWGLADATRDSHERQSKLPAEHVAKMRLLWSLMRMWMEWSYAWSRWDEFHDGER